MANTQEITSGLEPVSSLAATDHRSIHGPPLSAQNYDDVEDRSPVLHDLPVAVGLGYEAEFFEFFELNSNWMN